MLRQIRVKNFALIEDGFLEFGEGLNVLTGQTGAGKSILMAALGFVLGDRLESEWLRPEKKLSVEAVFEISKDSPLEAILTEHSFDVSEGILSLRREADEKSRSRSFANGILVTAGQIKSVAKNLVDIFQQGASEALFESDTQINLVDSYAGITEEVESYSEVFGRYQQLHKGKKELLSGLTQKEREIDLLEYQVSEIESAAIDLEHDNSLADLKIRLSSAEKIGNIYEECSQKLHESDESALSMVGGVNRLLASLKVIDSSEDVLRLTEEGEVLEVKLAELYRQLEAYGRTLEHDPGRLEEILGRINMLDNLKKKYGGSLEEVVSYLESSTEKLEFLKNSDENIKKFDEELEALELVLDSKARELSGKRKKSALSIQKTVESELQTFEMGGAIFKIHFALSQLNSKGRDEVEFQLAANPGEELKALSMVASGGEVSRIQLILKKVFSEIDPVGTLIFDEIDSGIGGRLAPSIGEKLKSIARKHEVISITHLAPVASQADLHWHAGKLVKDGKTKVVFQRLEGDEREQEIAKMLSGQEVTETALQHAKEILKS